MPNFSQTRDYLYSLRDRGSKYGLTRMERLVGALDNPERSAPAIHVAGTNGKGSVCAMLEALYRSNGYKTGLYTSPHLVDLGERIQVDRRPIPQSGIAHYTELLRPVAASLAAGRPGDHPSFFEFMTAMAFLHFQAEAVSISLLETGLGGRLDATNVVQPELSIITSISLDHTELLGDSLEQIASEKGGILKSGRPALLGKLPPEAERTLRAIAADRGCPLFTLEERFPGLEGLPATNLAGDFQRLNAGLALRAVELLSERFPLRSTEALRSVDWPGRWQELCLDERRIILDATHNPEGCRALDTNLARQTEADGSRPIIVAGTLGNDRAAGLMPVVAGHARELYLVQPRQPRACTAAVLHAHLPADCELQPVETSVAALFPGPGRCSVGKPGDRIVVTGSIYLLGEVLGALGGRSHDALSFQDKLSE